METQIYESELISWIEAKRKSSKMTYRGLAEKLGISHTWVTKILKGKVPASFEFCVKSAKYFGQPIFKFVVMGEVIPDEFELKTLISRYLELPQSRQAELLIYVDMLLKLSK